MNSQPSTTAGDQQRTLQSSALAEQKPIYRRAIAFSMVTSILVLAPTVFMLEVYDRVVNSRSGTTLISLLICLIGIYILMEVIEMLRGRLLQQAGWRIDAELREKIHDAAFLTSLRHGASSMQPFNDLRTIREFIASPAVTAMMDAPSSLLFLVLVSIMSPWLGIVALFGAAVQVLIGVSTERKTMPVLTEANQAAISAQNYASGVLRNAQVISAMGMKNRIYQRWIARQRKFLSLQAMASDTAGSNSATSKFIQTMQGSLILGLSCWLTVKGMLLGGGGMMIVASTLGGRVLSPLVQLIAQWRLVVNARDSYRRLWGHLLRRRRHIHQQYCSRFAQFLGQHHFQRLGGRLHIKREFSFLRLRCLVATHDHRRYRERLHGRPDDQSGVGSHRCRECDGWQYHSWRFHCQQFRLYLGR
jgi:ATP-binding cassette subfamily C exporter for protease/lipase